MWPRLRTIGLNGKWTSHLSHLRQSNKIKANHKDHFSGQNNNNTRSIPVSRRWWLRTGMLPASELMAVSGTSYVLNERTQEKTSYTPGALRVCRAPQSHLPAPWPWVLLGRSASHPGWQRICLSPDASRNSKVGERGRSKNGQNVDY